MFITPHQQTCSRKHHEVLDLKNLLALVIRFCVCIALEASSSLFVSFDSWKRQRTHDSIIPISCWLGNTTNRFFMLSICGFRQDSVRQVENWLDSRIHTTGLYFCTIATIPWWWSELSKYVSFYYMFFNCLSKALMLQNIGETSCALLFSTYKTFFNLKPE